MQSLEGRAGGPRTLRHAGSEEPIDTTASAFGDIHRGIRGGNQGNGVKAVVGIDGHAQARGNRGLVDADATRRCRGLGQLLSDQHRIVPMFDLAKNNHELVAAVTADSVRLPQRPTKAAGQGHQELIAGQVPQRIVDVLEPVEVENTYGKRRLAPVAQGDRSREPVERATGSATRSARRDAPLGTCAGRSRARCRRRGRR